MNKREKVYHELLEIINEKFEIICPYLIIYGFAIFFITIGVFLILTPANPIEYQKWFFISIGLSFLMIGCYFLIRAIKFALGLEEQNV